jgi:hypothetical protein
MHLGIIQKMRDTPRIAKVSPNDGERGPTTKSHVTLLNEMSPQKTLKSLFYGKVDEKCHVTWGYGTILQNIDTNSCLKARLSFKRYFFTYLFLHFQAYKSYKTVI